MGNTQVVARVLPIYLHTAARNGLIERMRYLIDELHVNIDEKDHEVAHRHLPLSYHDEPRVVFIVAVCVCV